MAWPSIRETFHLQQRDLSWIFVGGGVSYFCSSFFAGRLLQRFNVGMLLAASSALVAASGFNYSCAQAWLSFALGSLLHGLGSGAIDAGLNHYVARHFSARHMNWLHACYSLGAMFGPVVMTTAMARAGSWRLGYLIVALTLLILSILFAATHARWNEPEKATTPSTRAVAKIGATVALRNRRVWLHIALFFVYTGLEVSVGQWSFTVLTESRGVGLNVAGTWVTVYWASILAGRIIFGFIVDHIPIDTLIRLSTIAALAGTILFAWNPVPGSAPLALALAGLGLAVIFPCLMTRTPQRFGHGIAAHAIGFQVGAAMLGAATLPGACGFVAQDAGLNKVPWAILGMATLLMALHELVLAGGKQNS